MTDLNALARKYRSGEVTLEQLKSQYKLSTSDIEKIKQINAKIDKELCVKDNSQPLPGSTEITLDDGTKVLAAKIRTVNQPKGGFVNVYMAQDGKQYYQYTDANGKQQKISTSWNYLGATLDNFTSSIGKMVDGHPIDGLVQMFSGAEDPRCLSIGEAPAAGFAKGAGWISKLKDVKSLGQLKDAVKSLVQKIKPAQQMKPSKSLPDGIDRNFYWSINGKKGEKIISEAFRFGNAAERHYSILNADNTAKVVSHLSKQLNKTIDPKELKLVSLAKNNKYDFKISYFDKASGQSYVFLQDGTPEMILSYQYSMTGAINGTKVDALWRGGNIGWEKGTYFSPTKLVYDGTIR